MNNIPRQDLINGLPIRWAFHCFMSGGPRWHFPEWRKYLLSPAVGDDIFDNLQHLSTKLPTSSILSFQNDTKNFLAYHKADTLAGFFQFWTKCCQDYEKLLAKHYSINEKGLLCQVQPLPWWRQWISLLQSKL